MNVSLPKLSVMLALLFLPFWQWAQPSSLETYQNTSAGFDFVSSPNTPSLSNPGVYGPFNGEVTIIETDDFNYTFTYTPDEGFIGTDQVRLNYWSTFPVSHLASVIITITVEPALIRAYHDYASTGAGQSVTVNVLDNDLSSNGIKILRAVPAVNHGTATYTEGEASVTFTPSADYHGLAHFNYVLCNGLGDCDEGTVSVSVMGDEDPEEDEIIQVFTKKNETEFILVPNDYSLVTGPANGTFDPGADVPEYTPATDFVGFDEIRFSHGGHEVIYAIEVLDLKENLFAFEDRAFTTLNAQVSIDVLENDYSVSGSCLSFTQAEHGTVVHPPGSPAGYFEYTPGPGFVGVDEFTYTSYLTACSGEPETATVYVFVSNFEPDRSTFYMSTPEETPIIIGYNVPVSTFRFEVSSQGDFGEAFFLSGDVNTTINGANIVGQNMLIYVPNEGIAGETDEFEITYCLEDPNSNACVVSKTVKIYMDILNLGGGNGPVCVGDCVWPGDTNFDGVVSMADLLPIGLSMGEVGSERPNATMSYWYGQYADDWGNLFGGENNSTLDLKHIDADGNSIVTALDTSAINLFYGRTHTMVPQVMPYAPYDFILEGPLFVEPGDLVEIKVKVGAAGMPAEDVYGFVFPYTYNPEFIIPESVRVNWHSNNWLNYNSPVLHMQHNSLEGFLESGYTRTSGIAASGHGEIGVLEAIITDDLIGFRNDKEEIILPMGGIDGQAMNSAGQMTKVHVQPFNLRIRLNQEHTGLRDEQLKTFPNPTNQYLTVHLNGQQEFEALQLFSMTGQVVKTISGLSTNHAELDLNQLPNGIYILQVKTTDGILNRKIEVLH